MSTHRILRVTMTFVVTEKEQAADLLDMLTLVGQSAADTGTPAAMTVVLDTPKGQSSETMPNSPPADPSPNAN